MKKGEENVNINKAKFYSNIKIIFLFKYKFALKAISNTLTEKISGSLSFTSTCSRCLFACQHTWLFLAGAWLLVPLEGTADPERATWSVGWSPAKSCTEILGVPWLGHHPEKPSQMDTEHP